MNEIETTRAWVEEAVIGLDLCPFARAVQARGQIRYVACPATDADGLFSRLMGDEVEPRREFIQDNALSVANLDI